jgi:hypothetical protein
MRRNDSSTRAIQAGSLHRGDYWCGQKVAVLISKVINSYPATFVYIAGQKDPIELHCNDIVRVVRK